VIILCNNVQNDEFGCTVTLCDAQQSRMYIAILHTPCNIHFNFSVQSFLCLFNNAVTSSDYIASIVRTADE